MSFLLSIIPTIIVLGVLIFIHELGHFLACRMTGVRVEKFSIGFGPEIFHWQTKRTRYAVSLLPLGGFVKPAGEALSEVGDKGLQEGDYLAAPLPARIFIVIAGVLMNYFLAFALFAVLFTLGRPVPGTIIGKMMENYPAATSGLQVGDKVVQVGDEQVRSWVDLTEELSAFPGNPIPLVVERSSENGMVEWVPLTVPAKSETVKDVFGKSIQVKRLGIMPSAEAVEFEKYAFPKSLVRAWDTGVYLTVMTHKAIFALFTGQMSLKTLAGPVGIISITGTQAKLGLPYLLQLMATLSISLAVINLLPIPALDGGHFLFLLIEAFRRKPVSLKAQEKASQIGFALLMTLMVFVIYNDLVNLNAFEKIKTLF